MHVAITRRLSSDGVIIGVTCDSTRLCKNEKYLPFSCRVFLNHLPCSSAASFKDLVETGRASLKGVDSEDCDGVGYIIGTRGVRKDHKRHGAGFAE